LQPKENLNSSLQIRREEILSTEVFQNPVEGMWLVTSKLSAKMHGVKISTDYAREDPEGMYESILF
jgi:hypothetical protein